MEAAVHGKTDPDSSVTARIVSEVADLEGIDPTAVDARLYDAVDPDALAAVVNSETDSRLTVSFDYAGYRVTVIADDEPAVDVTPLT